MYSVMRHTLHSRSKFVFIIQSLIGIARVQLKQENSNKTKLEAVAVDSVYLTVSLSQSRKKPLKNFILLL